MRDKLAAILLIPLFVFMFGSIAYYGFVAWFKGKQLPDITNAAKVA